MRQFCVNTGRAGVKESSGDLHSGGSSVHAVAGGFTDRGDSGLSRRAARMADVAYVALTLGIFGLLALMLRGLEKLQS